MDAFFNSLGHIKKISVFWVTSLEIFGRVVTHIFFLFNYCFLFWKKIYVYKTIFFPENLKKF